MKLSYLDLYTTDPTFNLAAEQYVFDSLPRDRMYFMLWQNDNAIIIGKYQNTQAEVNAAYVQEHGIKVVRRLSGGGAVYHDMGNLNFTFIADVGNIETIDMHLFCEPIVRTLKDIGVEARVNGRNDITIDGQKFSGNSQYIRQGRVMHHGTLMFDSDLSIIGHALQVDESKIQAKGIKSVRSRVTTVRSHLTQDISLSQFRQILLQHILSENPGEEYKFTEEDLEAIRKLQRERYSQWDWNYGFSPECTMKKRQRIEGCGLVEAYITADKGRITDLTFRGDYFSTDDPQELAGRLIGCRTRREDYAACLEDVDVGRYFSGLSNEAFVDLLDS